MELELFTVSIKKDGTVGIDFNEVLEGIITEEELQGELTDKMQSIIPIVKDVVDFLKANLNTKE